MRRDAVDRQRSLDSVPRDEDRGQRDREARRPTRRRGRRSATWTTSAHIVPKTLTITTAAQYVRRRDSAARAAATRARRRRRRRQQSTAASGLNRCTKIVRRRLAHGGREDLEDPEDRRDVGDLARRETGGALDRQRTTPRRATVTPRNVAGSTVTKSAVARDEARRPRAHGRLDEELAALALVRATPARRSVSSTGVGREEGDVQLCGEGEGARG